MRIAIISILMLALCAPALAGDLGARRPDKPAATVTPPPVDPAVLRQGGDTILDATPIPGLPYTTAGTTAGYTHNYGEQCPYGPQMAPDVVYSYTPEVDIVVRVDLCGSLYDTQTYVYDADLYMLACNDDFYFDDVCGQYTSCIEQVALPAGSTYYIVIDGYGNSAGDYLIEVSEFELCDIDVPAAAVPEGEPPLQDGYQDAFNGGCNSPEFGAPFQSLVGDAGGALLFAGRGGWYLQGGSEWRDTDWFVAEIGPGGVIEVTILCESPSYFFELGPQDCAEVDILTTWTVYQCQETLAQVAGEPGSLVWLWFGSQLFSQPSSWPDNEYDYLLDITGLAPGTVTVETRNWTAVKALFR